MKHSNNSQVRIIIFSVTNKWCLIIWEPHSYSFVDLLKGIQMQLEIQGCC